MKSSITAQPFKTTARLTKTTSDVWSMVNAAAGKSPVQPIANLGQGFYGYNPPNYVIDAAKKALDRVDCNQYAPTKGRPSLKKAVANAYSPFFGHDIDPEKEVVITTGANEGMLSALMAFVEPGDEVIVFEPFFDQYKCNIQLAGATIIYVPLTPPLNGATEKASSAEWTLDVQKLVDAITPNTRMMIINSPHNPIGKIFSRTELEEIAKLCVEHHIIILSDEVYDRLYYVPYTRIATLSPEVANLTLTVGSVGKAFYATGWRVGYLIGPEHLITHVCTAHTWICYATPGPFQEAAAVGFNEAESRGFWEESKRDMKAKMDRFNEIWDELGLPYTDPQGGYFVLVNTSKVKIPEDYRFPSDIAAQSRDYRLSWFFINEFGVAAIPPTDFYSTENKHLAENYLRFAVCKPNDVLDLAKERLRGLSKYINAAKTTC